MTGDCIVKDFNSEHCFSNRNMFLSSANGGMVQGSPVPMEHVHPMHHALPPGGMGMGLELMNSLSPATSGFMAPMHTAANSVGGGSGSKM